MTTTHSARGASRSCRSSRRHAVACALDALERLVLADRTAEPAAASRNNLLSVAGTATPAERAWVLAWHLLAATARLHSGASAGGRPMFGERESSDAATLTRQALGELKDSCPDGAQARAPC
jgi:hypothetical protein